MRVLHLSTSDIDQGAARAAYRLHQGLKEIEIDSEMLVRSKSSLDRTVISESGLKAKLGPFVNNLLLNFYPNRDRDVFSIQWFPDALKTHVEGQNPDIINLHWVGNGFLKIESLKHFKKPLVWSLHDMWSFTGGCHYSQDCTSYKHNCGRCPHLSSQTSWDLSRWTWQRKATHWRNLNLTVVSPSQWLADCAKESSIFTDYPIRVIPFGLNIDNYRPRNASLARQMLNLPQDKKLVLFGTAPGLTQGSRKGIQYLLPALQKLKAWQTEIELVVFGAVEPEKKADLGFPIHYLGRFADDLSLSLVYSAADVMVVPSVQEAFGQTASESLACGTPVVAFDATGLKDIVDSQVNGYLAKPFDEADLAHGIRWILADRDRYNSLCQAARHKAEREFSLSVQARRYQTLYAQLLERVET